MNQTIKITLAGLFILLLTVNHEILAQKRLNLEVGAALPEGANIGIRWHYRNYNRLDFTVGTDFSMYDNDNTFTLAANHAFYFAKVNDKIGRKTWAFNTAPVFTYYNSEYRVVKTFLLSTYFSKEIVLSRRLLLEPELGASFELHQSVKVKKNDLMSGCVDLIPFIPKVGLNLIFVL